MKEKTNFLIKNGLCEYKILLPQNCSKNVLFAKDEFVELFKLATGVSMNFITENVMESNQKYISIGETFLFVNEKIEFDKKSLGTCGFVIKSKNHNIYLAGNCYGIIYSVYEFFHKTFGYIFYAEDEIVIEKTNTKILREYNISVKPDIEARSLGFHETVTEGKYLHRLKLSRTLYTGWIMVAHTYFKILPKEIYYKNHQDWYSPDGTNLCVQNEEMLAEFIKNLKIIISENKDDEFIMLGQEDNDFFCNCEKCRLQIEKYGTASALMMQFANKVARQIKAWLDEVEPTRKLTLVTFAYNSTSKAPAKFNNQKRIFEPIDSSVIAEENVAVMIVPHCVTTIYSTDYFDETKNKIAKDNFLAWKSVSKRLHVWSYCVNFGFYMFPFVNWRAIGKNYKILKNLGVEFVFDQANHNNGSHYFRDMKIYVQASLLWNTNQNVNLLIDDFMKQYYKNIYPQIKNYFDLVQARWDYIENEYALYLKSVHYLNEREFWSKEYLDCCMNIFDDAFKKLEKIKESDVSVYNLLLERLRRETMSVRFILLHLYSDSYGNRLEKVVKNFEDDCKEFGIVRYNEANTLELIRKNLDEGRREYFN